MKKIINGILTLVFIMTIGSLAACQSTDEKETPAPSSGSSTMSEEEKAAVDQLAWLNTQNPAQDAQAMLAINGKKPELIAFSGRGLSYPGLSASDYTSIEKKVSYRIAEGSGDVIYGNAHLEMRKKLRDYAEVYNQTILAGLQ